MGSTPHPAIGAQPFRYVWPTDLSPDERFSRYMSYKPTGQPILLQYGTQAAPVGVPTLPTAVADNVVAMSLPEAFGNRYIELYQTTAQTLMPNIAVDRAKGLEISLDQVDNESVEYVPGGNSAASPFAYVVPAAGDASPTAAGIFIRAIFELADSDGIDQMLVGFRKQEPYVVPTSFLTTGDGIYTDFAGIGFAAIVAIPNVIRTATDLNNSGSTLVTSTGFTVADAGVVQLEVRLKGGKVSYLINNVLLGDSIAKNGLGASITAQATTTPPIFTFDAGDTIIPFIFIRQDAGVSTVFLSNRHTTRAGLVVGTLRADGLDANAR